MPVEDPCVPDVWRLANTLQTPAVGFIGNWGPGGVIMLQTCQSKARGTLHKQAAASAEFGTDQARLNQDFLECQD